MNIFNALSEYGLDQDEINLYLASIKLGEASMSQLAKVTGIKRTTAYLVYSRLEKRGLMGKFKMRSGLKFIATNPNKLEKLAQQRLESIKKIIPDLNLYSQEFQEKPEVSIFNGKDGYLSIFDDPLQCTGITIRAIGSLQNIRKIITTEYDENYFVPERLRKGISFKGLYFQKEIKEMGLTPEKNQKEKRIIKALPAEYFQSTFTMIYENTVVKFTSEKENIALKIVSPEIAKAEKANFDLLWSIIDKE